MFSTRSSRRVYGKDLCKTVETITASITDVDNLMTTKVDEVKAKVVVEIVGMGKEIASTAVNKEATIFGTSHQKDYAPKFFKSLLDDDEVAPLSKIEAINNRIEQTENAHNAISKITTSVSVANQANAAVKPGINSLHSSHDKMKQQLDNHKEQVKNLTSIIRLLSDYVKKKKKKNSSSLAQDVVWQVETTRPTTSAQVNQPSQSAQAKLIVGMMNDGASMEETSNQKRHKVYLVE